jgi:antitoxin component of RelBE/YafQ-DinJ toxin-antitoxin module
MAYMPPPHALNIRLASSQYKTLEKLAKKLNIGKTDVIRLALTRLAETEGVISHTEEA